MSRVARPLYISERQRQLLEKEQRRSNLPSKYIPRIKIVLSSSLGKSNGEVGSLTGACKPTVIKWRTRWIESYDLLQTACEGVGQKGINDKTLLSLMMTILDDAQRSGAPCIITEDQCSQIQAMACSKPSDYGYPITHWTHEELSKAVVEQGILDSISSTHVGRILKKQISPS